MTGSSIIFGSVLLVGFEIFLGTLVAYFGSFLAFFSFLGSFAPFLLSFLLDFFSLSLRISSFFYLSNSYTFFGMVGLMTYNSESTFLSGIALS